MKDRISAHHEDPWADVIILNGIRSLRLVIRERYKTSELSGDEWRFGYMWQVLGSEWTDLDGSYGSQDAAIAAFYPAFRTSHPDWHDNICNSTQFTWKGQPLIEMSDDGKPMPLLHAIGCVSWAMRAGRSDHQWKKDDSNVCAQPGCCEKPVSLFRKTEDWYQHIGKTHEHYDGKAYRQFCKAHLRRGDCGLDDADRNYELIEGLGPDGNEPDPSVVKPSLFGGIVQI